MVFRDRHDAGRRLAAALEPLAREAPVVVGLPRGGVPVAYEVAAALQAPLDVILVRKVGVPYQPELAMGAIGEDGIRVVNDDVVQAARVGRDEFERVEARERAELERRARQYRVGLPALSLSGRTVVIVDDGIATGSTARAACQVARAHGATQVVLATPVASPRSLDELAAEADRIVCLEAPRGFQAVGERYADFSATSDEEVVELLRRARSSVAPHPPASGPASGPAAVTHRSDDPPHGERRDEEVSVAVDGAHLAGHLTVPDGATGIIIFAHGSGSSRHSARNRYVASVLVDAGFATLLFDLLTSQEEALRANVFDIPRLADRLGRVTTWVRGQPGLTDLPVGWFGASTGAGAALWAAAEPGCPVAAVVSRGGRPDLAGPRLASVQAPTLLIVGGEDDVVLDLNRQALRRLRAVAELVVVPGATHLFEEPGTLDVAARLAREWFVRHLSPAVAARERSVRQA